MLTGMWFIVNLQKQKIRHIYTNIYRYTVFDFLFVLCYRIWSYLSYWACFWCWHELVISSHAHSILSFTSLVSAASCSWPFSGHYRLPIAVLRMLQCPQLPGRSEVISHPAAIATLSRVTLKFSKLLVMLKCAILMPITKPWQRPPQGCWRSTQVLQTACWRSGRPSYEWFDRGQAMPSCMPRPCFPGPTAFSK